ncbi:EF-hand domain-containing protein [Salinisphaera sp. T31B1]|uniref:EF-hand domain-containing protein n=1 Tax=Salinisphaera sp. T31B1 TaxID=727963 RepID=UPI0033418EAE
MFKKTAIALSLAMVAGSGLAAQGSAMSGSASASGMDQNANVDASVAAQFRSLDTNGDGVISRSEASKDPALAKAYDSFDTSATMEADARQNGPVGGITLEQYEAGMQAAHSNAGVVGDSVSGGQTYIMMKDGSKRLKSDTSNAQQRMRSGASNMQERAGGAMSSSSQRMQQGVGQASDTMHEKTMRRASDGYDKARTTGSDTYDSARGTAGDAGMRSQGEVHEQANY